MTKAIPVGVLAALVLFAPARADAGKPTIAEIHKQADAWFDALFGGELKRVAELSTLPFEHGSFGYRQADVGLGDPAAVAEHS